MPQLVNATPERIANHFVNNLFEQNSDSLHIRRVAFWVGLIVLGIEKVASARYVPGARQLRFDYNNQTYKATFNHHAGGSQRGGIDIIEILPGRKSPEGSTRCV